MSSRRESPSLDPLEENEEPRSGRSGEYRGNAAILADL